MISRKKGIVVGCASYTSPSLHSLKYTEADARAIHERLIDEDSGGFAPEDLQLLISPDSATLNRAILKQLRAAQPTDSFLLYFAGHGLRDESGRMYLATADTDVDLLEATSVHAQFVRDQLDRCRSKQICVILDCCFSGAFGHEARGPLQRAEIEAGVTGLSGEGTVILTSAQPSQYARERDDYQHGVFTYHLLKGIDGDADVNADGVVTPVELFHYVASRMEAELGPAQRPTLLANMAGGTFPLVRSLAKRKAVLLELTNRIAELRERHEHEEALQQLAAFHTANAAETKQLTQLAAEVRAERDELCRAFRSRIVHDASSSALQHDVGLQLLEILKRDSDSLFVARPPTRELRVLRRYLLQRIDASTLSDIWHDKAPSDTIVNTGHTGDSQVRPALAVGTMPPPLEPAPTVKTSPHDSQIKGSSRRMQVAAWTALVTALLAGVSFFAKPWQQSAVDPDGYRVGILLKNEWLEDHGVVEQAFTAVFDELNLTFSRAGLQYRFKTPVRTYGTVKNLLAALKSGDVDIVGELSPRDVYDAYHTANFVPFIGPEYDGSQTYSAVYFISSESPLLGDGGKPHAELWEATLHALEIGDGLIAVTNRTSTSGYWYPRGEILNSFQARGVQKSFDDVILETDSQDELFTLVACRRRRVITGVTAEFRLRTEEQLNREFDCGNGRRSRLVPIHRSPAIPHGAYSLRSNLAADRQLVSRLGTYWPDVVNTVFGRPELATLNVPRSWTVVSMATYRAAADTFELRDDVGERRSREQKRLVLVAGAFALLISFLYFRVKYGAATYASGPPQDQSRPHDLQRP